ncbi:MAG TPA: hypothetical protein VGH83_01070 [Candidatus Acidoferrum sp.]|jgi:hypothetical protein
MTTFRHKALPCPACSYSLDASTAITGNGAPEPRDFTICWQCGEMLVFTATMGLRGATLTELAELMGEQPEEFQTLMDACHGIQKAKSLTWN